jgi:hypothetical protein
MKISGRNMLIIETLQMTALLTRFGVAVTVKMHFLELATSVHVTNVNKKLKLSL